MQRTLPLRRRGLQIASIRDFSTSRTLPARPPLVRVQNGTFYRKEPSQDPTAEEAITNRPLFPGLDFEFPADSNGQYWAVVGPSNAGKTTFLDILRGQNLCFPPVARTYPYLSSDEIAAKDPRLRYPGRAIQYVGFDNKPGGLSGVGTYLSARYESRREITDFSLQDFLLGNTQLNHGENSEMVDEALLERVANDLKLLDLMKMPVSNLSNGQTRRARIAKALLGKPELLLLDEPFMGLDPPTTMNLSPLLGRLAEANDPRVLLTLRPQDPIPDWITHVLFLGGLGGEVKVTHRGTVREVSKMLMDDAYARHKTPRTTEDETIPLNYSEFGRVLSAARPAERHNEVKPRNRSSQTTAEARAGKGSLRGRNRSSLTAYQLHTHEAGPDIGEPVIEFEGVVVSYGEKTVLGGWRQDDHDQDGLYWTVRRGERWGVFGPNGSGKTTLLSMITSDHPQAYSQPLKMFGRHRLPSPGIPGISVFELQSRIGHSSPEVHSFFPRSLTVRKVLESAFADTPLSRPKAMTAEDDKKIEACLKWFQAELNPSAGNSFYFKSLALKTPGKLSDIPPQNKDVYKELSNAFRYDLEREEEQNIEWADELLFGELPFSAQRVALFLRAIVREPDIVILDEAFGGMDDYVRDKCLLFLEHGEDRYMSPLEASARSSPYTAGHMRVVEKRTDGQRHNIVMHGLTLKQALVVVSHIKEEIPTGVRDWIYLPEASRVGQDHSPASQCRIGRSENALAIRSDSVQWADIWGMRFNANEEDITRNFDIFEHMEKRRQSDESRSHDGGMESPKPRAGRPRGSRTKKNK